MNPVIAIVSDDLTGSGDTAVQFVRAGWSTHLSIGGADEALAGDGQAEVLAVTTHSRALPADQAAGIVRANVERLRQAGVKRSGQEGRFHAAGPVPGRNRSGLRRLGAGRDRGHLPCFSWPPAGPCPAACCW